MDNDQQNGGDSANTTEQKAQAERAEQADKVREDKAREEKMETEAK